MTFIFRGSLLAAATALGLAGPASADDVLFENVRIFDGTGARSRRRRTCWSWAT